MKHLLIVSVLLLAVASVKADPGDPGNLGPQPGPQPTSVPVDGGASLLLAAGGSYAIKKLKNRNRKQA